MTVSTEVNENTYTGNGTTTVFPYQFRVYKKSDLVVQVVDLSETIKTLTLDTDYTVSGAGGYQGGNVTLTSPLATGWKISITRELPVTQETDLRNQGSFFAEVHEDAFDKLTMLLQQIRRWFGLALRKPTSIANWYDALNNYIRNVKDPRDPQDAATKNYVDAMASANLNKTLRTPENIPAFPDAASRANKIVAFDSLGNPVASTPASGSAADVMLQLASNESGKGASLVTFVDPVTGVTTVDAALKTRPTNSALLAGNGSAIGYRFSSDSVLRNVHDRFAETLSILDYVQSTDAGDYSLALQRIFTKYVSATGFHVLLPSGTLSFKTQAVYNGTATVSIVGQKNTVLSLEYSAAGRNIAITTSGRIFLENFEVLVTEPATTGLKTGIYLNCTTLDNSHHIRSVRATTTINTSGKGVLMFDLYNVSLGAFSDCYIRYFGVYKSVAGSNNIAWRMQATVKISTDSMYRNCSVVGCEIPWLIAPPVGGTNGAYLEGVTWIGCTIVDCLEGPFISGDSSNAYRSPMYRWIGGHINARRRSFYAYWVSQIYISDAHIYLSYDSTSAPLGNYPIWLEQVTEYDVHNVSIHMFGQSSTDSHGVHVGPGCDLGSVTSITCFTPAASRAVVSYSGSRRCRVGNCVVIYSGSAPASAISLNGTQDLDMGNNTIYSA